MVSASKTYGPKPALKFFSTVAVLIGGLILKSFHFYPHRSLYSTGQYISFETKEYPCRLLKKSPLPFVTEIS
ncbi:hypothetical protein V6N13_015646 [Hibiscus sabdariffa]